VAVTLIVAHAKAKLNILLEASNTDRRIVHGITIMVATSSSVAFVFELLRANSRRLVIDTHKVLSVAVGRIAADPNPLSSPVLH
jgi:hypothetical protein